MTKQCEFKKECEKVWFECLLSKREECTHTRQFGILIQERTILKTVEELLKDFDPDRVYDPKKVAGRIALKMEEVK